MKLYWSPRSPFARKVLVFAHEAGLAGRIETVRTLVSMTSPNRELMRVNPLGNNMLDNLVPWRNEILRPKPQQSPEVLAGFELKIRSSLEFLDKEAAALGAASLGIGHVAIACALGYIDFRFPELGWCDANPRIAAWHAAFAQRPSIRSTMPVDQ